MPVRDGAGGVLHRVACGGRRALQERNNHARGGGGGLSAGCRLSRGGLAWACGSCVCSGEHGGFASRTTMRYVVFGRRNRRSYSHSGTGKCSRCCTRIVTRASPCSSANTLTARSSLGSRRSSAIG